MVEELKERIVRLKDQIRHIQQVKELHKKISHETEYELRKKQRQINVVKSRFEAFYKHFSQFEKSASDREVLDLCLAALKVLEQAVADL